MANIYEIDGVRPIIDASAFVHPEAVIIGDVIIGPRCYVGPFASLRGDFGQIVVCEGSNIQDSCTLHSFPERECRVDENGHVSHGAVLHGCHIKRYGFVGIKALVMDGAVVGEHAMVAAMAFIKADFEVPDSHLAAGVPAKIVREIDQTQREWLSSGPEVYQQLAERSINSLRPCEALTENTSNGPRLNLGGDPSKPYNEVK